MTPLPPLLQGFFAERLASQRDASPHTIAAYRDSFRLLLRFLRERTGKRLMQSAGIEKQAGIVDEETKGRAQVRQGVCELLFPQQIRRCCPVPGPHHVVACRGGRRRVQHRPPDIPVQRAVLQIHGEAIVGLDDDMSGRAAPPSSWVRLQR